MEIFLDINQLFQSKMEYVSPKKSTRKENIIENILLKVYRKLKQSVFILYFITSDFLVLQTTNAIVIFTN